MTQVTLTQHIQLLLKLLAIAPNRNFVTLYNFTKDYLSLTDMYIIAEQDIEALQQRHQVTPATDYLYNKNIHTIRGNYTLRWFVETELIMLLELRLKLKFRKPIEITLESLEILL